MKAVVVTEFGGPEALVVSTVPVPSVDVKSTDYLIRVHAAGVNPVETYIRAGQYAKLPALPWTPGNDGAGVVVRAPENGEFAVGARVWLSGSKSGSYAEFCTCTAAQVHALPDHLSFEQGAAVGIAYRTAYRALHIRSRAQAGQTILVHGGSGGVGLAAIQLAKLHGCRVIATAGTQEGLELVTAHGAFAVNHKTEGYMEEILKLTSGQGVNIVLEMLANVNLGADLTILARGGVVCVIGNRGPAQIDARQLMLKESSIVGCLGAGTPEESAQCFAGVTGALHHGQIQPVVNTPAFALEDASLAHIEVIEHKRGGGSAGKIVISTARL
jgi:NADPH2:quinone reductase